MSRLLAMLLILPSLCWGTFDHSYPSYAKLLQAYVSPHGMVNYRQLTENHEEASDVLQQFEAVSPTEFSTWNREQQLSFLINAYNMATIELIVSHYPSDSIRDLGGVFTNPFKLTFFSLLQKKQSLDGIEHGIIRANYREARIHFALVCASQSCPQLRSEPYIPEQLEAQLFSQTQQFLQESTKNTFDLEQKKPSFPKFSAGIKRISSLHQEVSKTLSSPTFRNKYLLNYHNSK